VDYGPQPVECVRWATTNGSVALHLQGNHDRAVAKDEDPRCSAPFRRLARVTQALSMESLGEGMRSLLSNLKPIVSF
jgi:hypothetical protein